jgi:hypothetical protein
MKLNRKDYRRFMRRLRASDMVSFLKTGCDMGWYGHFRQIEIDANKIRKVVAKIIRDSQPSPPHFSKIIDKYFWDLS